MQIALVLRVAAVGLSIATYMATVQAGPRAKALKVHVRFLATGTLIRGTWGQNQDTYLAELTDGALQLANSRSVASQFITLIDEYANEAPPLSAKVLASTKGTVLRVLRDSECDYPYSQLVLRSAPGDLMALARGKLTYTAKLSRAPQPGEIVPCYRVVR